MSPRVESVMSVARQRTNLLPAVIAALALGVATGCSVIPEGRSDPVHFFVLSTPASGGTGAPRGTRPPAAGVSAGTAAADHGSGAAGAGGGAAAANAWGVRLRPVELATYLRGRPLIVRRGDNEIEFRDFARWGEALDLGVARVVREELLARRAARTVLSSRREQGTADVALSIRVLACEGLADGGVAFRAAWEIVPAASVPNAPSPLAGLLRRSGGSTAKPGGGGESATNSAPARPVEVEKEKPVEVLASGEFRADNVRWDGKSDASLAAALSQAVEGLAAEIAQALMKATAAQTAPGS